MTGSLHYKSFGSWRSGTTASGVCATANTVLPIMGESSFFVAIRFRRATDLALAASASKHASTGLRDSVQVFAPLRDWRNGF